MTGTPPGDPYLSAEDGARVEIHRMLIQAGWVVQHAAKVNLGPAPESLSANSFSRNLMGAPITCWYFRANRAAALQL